MTWLHPRYRRFLASVDDRPPSPVPSLHGTWRCTTCETDWHGPQDCEYCGQPGKPQHVPQWPQVQGASGGETYEGAYRSGYAVPQEMHMADRPE